MMLRMLIHPETANVPGTHVGTDCTTVPSMGAGTANMNVRFVPLRLVTASFVPEQIWIVAVVYSPSPSGRMALRKARTSTDGHREHARHRHKHRFHYNSSTGCDRFNAPLSSYFGCRLGA